MEKCSVILQQIEELNVILMKGRFLDLDLLVVYFLGLLLGTVVFALTFYFSKEMDNGKRNAIPLVIGILVILGGLLIGGFEGMPISLMGAGIFSLSLLLLIAGKRILVRKAIFVLAVLIPLGVFSYTTLSSFNDTEFVVAAKDGNFSPDINKYYDHLQENTDIKGFKIFNSYEDEKAIVLSLGGEKKGNNIELVGVEKRGKRIDVTVRTFENKSTENNPTILIFASKLKNDNELIVKDTDGTVYKSLE